MHKKSSGSARLQSAMEYLMTYGWMILIIAVVLGALFQLGVFNSSSFSPRAPPSACQVFRPSCLGTTTTSTSTSTSTMSTNSTSMTSISTMTIPQLTQSGFSVAHDPISFNSIQTLFANVIGGKSPYTYGFAVYNAIGHIIASFMATNVSATNQSFSFNQLSSYGVGTFTANTIAYDSSNSLGLGSWFSTTPYPHPIYKQTCSYGNGYVYCVGGLNNTIPLSSNQTYYASLNAWGIGSWARTTDYPLHSRSFDCPIYNNTIYCLVGLSGNSNNNAKTYYASISGLGVGAWSNTTNYPCVLSHSTCPEYNGTVYCVGNFNSCAMDSVYHSNMTPSGLSAWIQTMSYPNVITYAWCGTYNGFMYCVGGYSNGVAVNQTYFSQIIGQSLSAWNSTTPYPVRIQAEACSIWNGYIYCVGGYDNNNHNVTNSYYARLSASGIGGWNSTTPYPIGVNGHRCVNNNGLMCCIGGQGNSTLGTNGITDLSYCSNVNTQYGSIIFNSLIYNVNSNTTISTTTISVVHNIGEATSTR